MKYADSPNFLTVHIIVAICQSTRDQLFIERYEYKQLSVF